MIYAISENSFMGFCSIYLFLFFFFFDFHMEILFFVFFQVVWIFHTTVFTYSSRDN
jgi:hypothetical protein